LGVANPFYDVEFGFTLARANGRGLDLPCCEKRAQCVRDPVQRNLGADTQEQESGQTCQYSGAGLTKKADQMIR
jgi:hypothetical protein